MKPCGCGSCYGPRVKLGYFVTLLGLVVLALFLARCSGTSTSPSEVDNVPGQFATAPMAGPDSVPSGQVPAPAPAPEPSTGLEFSWDNIVRTANSWSVDITNRSGNPAAVGIASFHDPDRAINTQTLYRASYTTLEPGETKTLGIELPCGRWQADAFEGDVVEPPFFGRRLIVGRIGDGGSCAPPPPPTCEQLGNCPPPPPPPPECEEEPCGPPPPPPCQTFGTDECPPPPPPCVVPDIGTVLSWKGAGNPLAECSSFGNFVPGPPGFTLCKAGNDREVVANGFRGATCPNGKDVSHLTTCGCPE